MPPCHCFDQYTKGHAKRQTPGDGRTQSNRSEPQMAELPNGIRMTAKGAFMRSRLLVFLFAFLFTAPLFAADRPLAASAFPLPVPQYLAQIFTDAGHAYNLDPNLIAAVAFHESAFNTRELSPIGATGLMQLLPNTGR